MGDTRLEECLEALLLLYIHDNTSVPIDLDDIIDTFKNAGTRRIELKFIEEDSYHTPNVSFLIFHIAPLVFFGIKKRIAQYEMYVIFGREHTSKSNFSSWELCPQTPTRDSTPGPRFNP